MKRVTLTVVALLLAAPALAQAKVGIEFNVPPQQSKPGERQDFSVMLMREPRDRYGEPQPIEGAHPVVTFRNTSTDRVLRVRTSATGPQGIATGSVVFPDEGPWLAGMRAQGRDWSREMGSIEFTVGPPTGVRVVGVMRPPADPEPAPAADDGSGGPPAWLLTLPIAGLAALGIWISRRRPREMGA